MAVDVTLLDPASAQARSLIAALDRHLKGLYPADSNHLDSIEELSKPWVRFVGAFDHGLAVGCGAVKLLEGYGEIKRLYVAAEARGQGVGRQMLGALEELAREAGCPVLRLETGVHQAGALKLFERCGFIRTGPFGPYTADPLSVFMEKTLDVARSGPTAA